MSTAPRSLFSRLMTATRTVIATGIALGIAAGLVWVGTGEIAARAERLPSDTVPDPLPVATVPLLQTDAYTVSSRYSGRVESRQAVDLGFEDGGTLALVDFDEGDRLAADAVIARLDTRTLEAQRAAELARRDAVRAEADLAQLTADRQRALLDRDHVSRQRYDEARLAVARLEAEVRAAEAAIATIDVQIDKAVLRAPFDAVVGDRLVDPGTRVAGGAPVVTLYEDAPLQFRAGLPEDLAQTLAPGAAVEIRVGADTHAATVARVRPDVDPATRTRAVIFDLTPGARVAEGALGAITLDRQIATAGAWVPASALAEGVRGLWTLFVVEETDAGPQARREAVELIHAEADRAYVRGQFAASAAAVVSEGPHRLSDGQPVLPLSEEG